MARICFLLTDGSAAVRHRACMLLASVPHVPSECLTRILNKRPSRAAVGVEARGKKRKSTEELRVRGDVDLSAGATSADAAAAAAAALNTAAPAGLGDARELMLQRSFEEAVEGSLTLALEDDALTVSAGGKGRGEVVTSAAHS